MMHINELPPELLDAILEWLWTGCWGQMRPLHDRYQDVNRCSLVCSHWRERACRLLFRSITYSFRWAPDKDIAQWARLRHGPDGRWGQRFGEPEKVPYKTLEMFISFLDNAPHIAPFVQDLTLLCYPTQWQQSMAPDQPEPIPLFTPHDKIDPGLLASLLQLLPQLVSLETENVVPTHPLTPGQQIKHRSLKTLKIKYDTTNPQTRDAEMLLRCLHTIPNLHLRLGRPGLGHEWPQLAVDTQSCLAVETLWLISVDFIPPPLLDMLVHSPTTRTLRSLRLEDLRATALPAMQALLNAAGSGVQRILYNMLSLSFYDGEDQTLDFTPCRALKRLLVSVDLEADRPDQMDDALTMVASVFTAMTATRDAVYEDLIDVIVEMCIDMEAEDDLSDMDLSRHAVLEQALDALMQRSAVKKITVNCVCEPVDETERTAIAMIKTMLPDLYRRKHLKIVTDG